MNRGAIELLAPAGSYEAMVAAVQNGANAIYLSGQLFGARAYATNFTNEELKQTVHYCHLRHVLVYVTVNTLYKDSQFSQLIDYITFLQDIDVDALIIQDMGLYHIIREHFPHFEIHISTQMSVRNLEGVRFFEPHVDRVVLAREMSIEEISHICHNSDIDIEVFVHGALCMSYSGQCLMSSMIAKRSGNKGQCGQPCRLPYEFYKDGKYQESDEKFLLSPKDLCSIEHVDQLIKAGIKSFKIEGRMKKPEYVATVVKYYRQAIDAYYKKHFINTHQAIIDMKKMFNRGFTGGFLLNDKEFVSSQMPGNRGIKVASIEQYNHKTKRLSLRLIDDLHQGDRLFFYNEEFTRTVTKLFFHDHLVSHATVGDIVEIELNQNVDLQQDVYKISDYLLNQDIEKHLQKENLSFPIAMKVTGELHQPLSLTLYNDKKTLTVQSQCLIEEAIKTPLGHERIKEQFAKLGPTLYHLEKIDIQFPGNGTLPIKELNRMRREAVELFDQVEDKEKSQVPSIAPIRTLRQQRYQKLSIMIHDLKQLDGVDYQSIDEIFIPFYLIDENHLQDKITPYIPYFYDENDLHKFVESTYFKYFNSILVSDYGAYQICKDKKDVILNYHFNLTNSYSHKVMQESSILSYEMTKQDIKNIQTDKTLYFTAYGRIANMNLKHCLISQFYLGKKQEHCQLCKKGHYQIKDRKNKYFDIMCDPYCHNTILHCFPLQVEDIQDLNVDSILLNFTIEDSSRVQEIISHYDQIINNGYIPVAKDNNFTGYY